MKVFVVLLVLGVMVAGIVVSGGPAYTQPSRQYGQYGQYGRVASALGDRELRNLVAPIALYPDPLLAIILPASTYVDEVIDADRRNLGNNEAGIGRQNWDISVRALAHYPGLTRMMAQDPDWTAALGQAYVNQPQDVMDAIQYLRQRARDNGVLRSNQQQRIYLEGGYIRIVPAQANHIYIPSYDPNVVYLSQRGNRNQSLLSFGLGLIIGSWLNNDTDWQRHRVYQHGWQGGGWINAFRKQITVNDTYTRNRNRSAVGNRDITRRPVDFGKLKTYRLPGVTPGTPLNYRRAGPGSSKRDGTRRDGESNRQNDRGDNRPDRTDQGRSRGD